MDINKREGNRIGKHIRFVTRVCRPMTAIAYSMFLFFSPHPQQQRRLDETRGECMQTLCVNPAPVCDWSRAAEVKIINFAAMSICGLSFYDLLRYLDCLYCWGNI